MWEEGREVHPWFFEKEGGLRPRFIGRGNRCGKKEGRSIPCSLRRKEGYVPDLGRAEQIWEEGRGSIPGSLRRKEGSAS
jgi:hypothetical protein